MRRAFWPACASRCLVGVSCWRSRRWRRSARWTPAGRRSGSRSVPTSARPCWRSSRRSISRRPPTPPPTPALGWAHHVLKSGNYTGYVPFTLTRDRRRQVGGDVRARGVAPRRDAIVERAFLRPRLAAAPARRHAAPGGDGLRRHRRDADRGAGRGLVAAVDGGRPPPRPRSCRCSRRTWRSSSTPPRRRSGRRRRASSIRCCSRSRSTSSSTWRRRTAAIRGASSGRWRCRPASTTSTSG